jgi:hypothetical protein
MKNKNDNMYKCSYDIDDNLILDNLNNKLFATFTSKEKLEETLQTIKETYSILYGKIFVLESPDTDEVLCTYNIDPINSSSRILPNTILLHRKKQSNTLYTINSLNLLVKELNEGVADSTYQVNWDDYKNTVLLTQGTDLRKLGTKIHKIISA